MFRSSLLIYIFFLLFIFTPISTRALVIDRNFRMGDKDERVLKIQQFLNKDIYTQVAKTGPGSPGYETNYFGGLTKSAIIRFQELYRAEVLAPVGLSSGSGFVGSMTRAKLAQIKISGPSRTPQRELEVAREKESPKVKEAQKRLIQENDRIYISSVLPRSIYQGEDVIIDGFNFSPTGNQVFIEGKSLGTYSSPDTRTIKLKITGITMDKVGLRVLSVRFGERYSNDFYVFFQHHDFDALLPRVTSISPLEATCGTSVFLTGINLDMATQIVVQTPAGPASIVSSSDKSVVFKIPDYAGDVDPTEARARHITNFGRQMEFYVYNKYGRDPQDKRFAVTLI